MFCEILVAIVFGHEIHIFIPKFGKIHIFIPKSAYGEGGSAVSGNIPIPSLTKIRLERGRLPENLHLHGFPNLVQILIISDEKSNVELYFLLGKLSNFVSAKTL